MSSGLETTDPSVNSARLPLAGLLALFTAGFLGILNETVPAGLLPQMSASLGLPESLTGQIITVYAIATALTALPLNAVLRRVGRRTLLVWSLGVFAIANLVVAAQPDFTLILMARFAAGVAAGLIWANLGVFAAGLVPKHQQGTAISIALAGTPVALSLGLPLGTVLGNVASWNVTFTVMAALSAALVVWVLLALPNPGGAPAGQQVSLMAVLRTPGVRSILWVVAGYTTAHNLLYTYVGPLAARADVQDQLQWVLLVFGGLAALSIWLTGRFVTAHHRRLLLLSTTLVGAGAFLLATAASSAVLMYLAAGVWGFGFGGAATLFVTAGIRASGTDEVQAAIVTVFNVSIAAGGLFGGLLLARLGVASIPWVAGALILPTLIVVVAERRHAFPSTPAADT